MDILPTKCKLCPRECGVNRREGERGICGANDTLVIARAALHEWEEPPISVGKGSGTVFFSHCPLRCSYCQNASIAHEGQGKTCTVERLADIFLELQREGAANINLVTPTHYAPQIMHALTLAHQQGLVLPVVYNTSGYERASCIAEVAPFVDVFLTDVKYDDISDAAHIYSHAPNYFETAWPALETMVSATGVPQYDTFEGESRLIRGVIVRHMVLPGQEAAAKRLIQRVWNRFGTDVLYSIMSQYTPVRSFDDTPELNQPIRQDAYEALLDFCDELGIPEYFWQAGSAAQESFIPVFDGTGV